MTDRQTVEERAREWAHLGDGCPHLVAEGVLCGFCACPHSRQYAAVCGDCSWLAGHAARDAELPDLFSDMLAYLERVSTDSDIGNGSGCWDCLTNDGDPHMPKCALSDLIQRAKGGPTDG